MIDKIGGAAGKVCGGGGSKMAAQAGKVCGGGGSKMAAQAGKAGGGGKAGKDGGQDELMQLVQTILAMALSGGKGKAA
ncbi:MAG: hypothetical protein FJX76_10685 [Armatimonadetes bacterium]|nr:hypothetical protein [Armatimonadota bacterium]